MPLNNRILAVDDHVDNLQILNELLNGEYSVMCVTSGEEALRVAPQFQPNLILLDVMMPGLDGNQTCDMLRDIPSLADAKIVMVSARSELGDRLAAYHAGALDYITKPFHEREVLLKVKAWMQMAYKQQIDAIWNEVDRTREVMGSALVTMASFRDTETGEHLFRMRWYSELLAEQLSVGEPYREQIDEEFLRQLYRASPLHDIGKVGIDDSILRKPGRLTVAEFEIIKRHAAIGGDILAAAANKLPQAGYLKMAAEIARYHHERFDGSGYPEGLAGAAIPLAARIVAVADVFDALTSDRVYHQAISLEAAEKVIVTQSDRLFDRIVVEALRACHEDFRQSLAWFANGGLSTEHAAMHDAADPDRVGRRGADHIEHSLSMRAALAL